MKAGDLVFVRGHSKMSKIIRYFDKGRFSHVAIAVSETEVFEAQYNKLSNVVPMEYKDFEVVPMNLSEKELKLFAEFVEYNTGKIYDYPGLIRMMFCLAFDYHGFDKFNNSKAVICSELAADYLIIFDRSPDYVANLSPNQLYKYVKENLK